MKLRVKSDYNNRAVHYQKGAVLDVSPEEAQALLNDAPENFSIVKPKAPKRPPRDKAVRAPKVAK
jgi:hypothetical protein